MKAGRLMLVVMSTVLCGPVNAHAAETSSQALIDQGLFYTRTAAIDHPTVLQLIHEKSLGNFGLVVGEENDPFLIPEQQKRPAVTKKGNAFKDDISSQLNTLFAYFTHKFNVMDGFAYVTMMGQLNQGEDRDMNLYSSNPSQDFSIKPMMSMGYARNFVLPNGIFLMPDIHALYHYEKITEMQIGAGLSINHSDQLAGYVSIDTNLEPSGADLRARLSLKYHW